MVLVVVPALIPDVEKVYDVYFAAFEHEAMGALMLKVLFPGGVTPEFRKAHTEATIKYWHQTDLQYTFKCVDTDTGEVVGMMLGDWFMWERPEEDRKFLGVPWLEGEARERAEKVLRPLWETKEKLIGGKPHIYCHVIAVTPKHQGRKAGALLVQFGMDYADRIGMPIYFEASPTTAGLYTKMGFETLPETVVHKAETLGTPTDIVVPLMVRMPRGAGMKFAEWREKGHPKLGGSA